MEYRHIQINLVINIGLWIYTHLWTLFRKSNWNKHIKYIKIKSKMKQINQIENCIDDTNRESKKTLF